MDTGGTDLTQRWYQTTDGLLLNRSSQYVIGLPSADIGVGQQLICVPQGSGGAGFVWTQLPAIDSGDIQQWYFIQTGLPDSEDTLGLGLQGGSGETQWLIAPPPQAL